MGLDIAFSRAEALAAGLQITEIVRGTAIEIENCKRNGHDDDYCEWLSKPVEVIQVPYELFNVENGGGEFEIIVRANKWGRVYAPLTKWLKTNNIEWGEF